MNKGRMLLMLLMLALVAATLGMSVPGFVDGHGFVDGSGFVDGH
jgi:hypothetical protein